MRLFRSEEEIDAWCQRAGQPRGAVIEAPRLHRLATRWYGDRLDPRWAPRSLAASQAILADCGLTGEFWRLA